MVEVCEGAPVAVSGWVLRVRKPVACMRRIDEDDAYSVGFCGRTEHRHLLCCFKLVCRSGYPTRLAGSVELEKRMVEQICLPSGIFARVMPWLVELWQKWEPGTWRCVVAERLHGVLRQSNLFDHDGMIDGEYA